MILSIPYEKYTHHLLGPYATQLITASDRSLGSPHLNHVQVAKSF